MKARAVAGDMERATAFLNDIQQLDWRRYGQGGRSRTELAHMRARLEREQGGAQSTESRAGRVLRYRFRADVSAAARRGIFFKVLNTPARIEVIEKMGHLDREDVTFLTHAATFYRAVDHGMRISTGHAEGRLPTNPAQMAILTELVRRWTPPGFLDTSDEGTLQRTARRIRRETRAFFQRLFGPA